MSIDDDVGAPVPTDERALGVPAGPVVRASSWALARGLVALGLALSGGLFVGACASDGSESVSVGDARIENPSPPPPSAPATTAVTAPTTTVGDSDDGRAVRGFLAYLDAWTHVNGPARPGVDRLGEALTGEAFEVQMERTQNLLKLGMYVDLPDPSLLRADLLWVVEEHGRLTAEFCLLDGTRLMQVGSGRVLNDEVLSRRVRATYEVTGAASPRVAELLFLSRVDGDMPCV